MSLEIGQQIYLAIFEEPPRIEPATISEAQGEEVKFLIDASAPEIVSGVRVQICFTVEQARTCLGITGRA